MSRSFFILKLILICALVACCVTINVTKYAELLMDDKYQYSAKPILAGPISSDRYLKRKSTVNGVYFTRNSLKASLVLTKFMNGMKVNDIYLDREGRIIEIARGDVNCNIEYLKSAILKTCTNRGSFLFREVNYFNNYDRRLLKKVIFGSDSWVDPDVMGVTSFNWNDKKYYLKNKLFSVVGVGDIDEYEDCWLDLPSADFVSKLIDLKNSDNSEGVFKYCFMGQ